jgi:hypothetical protein
MADRLRALLPRIAALVLLGLAATAALSYAAGRNIGAAKTPAAAPIVKQQPVVVPDIVGQAFVFAKGALEDAGFAWRVAGSVHGYSANTVATQSPAPGTRVVDTGAPLVTLTLKRNGGYAQTGSAEDVAPYAGTPVQPAGLAAPTTTATTTSTASVPATTTAATRTTPAQTTPSRMPATKAKPATPAHAAPAAEKKTPWPQSRPPAFVVPGAKKEPLDEMPLPNRALALRAWLQTHPNRTRANVAHWLYQNEWIVTGAQLGWWRGAEALTTLVAVDRQTQSLWGIGAQSALVAQRALDEVKSKSK